MTGPTEGPKLLGGSTKQSLFLARKSKKGGGELGGGLCAVRSNELKNSLESTVERSVYQSKTTASFKLERGEGKKCRKGRSYSRG